jgi:hypothetical protein
MATKCVQNNVCRLKAATRSSQDSHNVVFKHVAMCKTTKTTNKCHLIHPAPRYATSVRKAKLSFVVLLYQICQKQYAEYHYTQVMNSGSGCYLIIYCNYSLCY